MAVQGEYEEGNPGDVGGVLCYGRAEPTRGAYLIADVGPQQTRSLAIA